MEGWPKQKDESIEKEPVFDYTFYDYSNRIEPTEIFCIQAHNNEEAFSQFEEKFGRKFGTEDKDGFIRK